MKCCSGRQHDVVVEDNAGLSHWCYIWADVGLADVIASVEGVVHASPDSFCGGNKYSVTLDKRYIPKVVRRKVEAAVKRAMKAKRHRI